MQYLSGFKFFRRKNFPPRLDGYRAENERAYCVCQGNILCFLKQWDKGSPVVVETIGNWYWIVEEIEDAQMRPRLVHARKAKLMLGMINKTDKLDARGLNKLQQTGTLPTVWIPPLEIRDKRKLPRNRMVFAHQRTRLKNRIHSVIDKYGLQYKFTDISDMFGKEGRKMMQESLVLLPEQTRPHRYVSKIYGRVRHRQGHAKAAGAVARHLAEATYWILTKKESYKERGISRVSMTEA